MVTQPNIRYTILFSQYRQYNYSNDGANYSLIFFKGSKIEPNPLVKSPTSHRAIVSPQLPNSQLPIQLDVSVLPKSTTKSKINQAMACSYANTTKDFSVYVPAALGKVNVCETSVAINSTSKTEILQALFLGTDNQYHAILIAESFDANKVTKANLNYVNQLNSELGFFNQYNNDIKTFIGSITIK